MNPALHRHIIWRSKGLVAYLHPKPWTPGSAVLESSAPDRLGGSVFHLDEQEYLTWMLGVRAVAELLCDRLHVRRCAMVTRPHADRPAQVKRFGDACTNRFRGRIPQAFIKADADIFGRLTQNLYAWSGTKNLLRQH